jgi:hypothetical protein
VNLETQIWKYISEVVDENLYLPSIEQVEEHFESEAAPYEVYEFIPQVRQDYMNIHKLDGVRIA